MLNEVRKALVPLVVAAAALAIQWSDTGAFNMSAEFVTAVTGVVMAVVVFAVRNLADDPARKAIAAVVPAGVAVAVQWIESGNLGSTKEFVTLAVGAISAVLVYYVRNGGSTNAVGSYDRV